MCDYDERVQTEVDKVPSDKPWWWDLLTDDQVAQAVADGIIDLETAAMNLVPDHPWIFNRPGQTMSLDDFFNGTVHQDGGGK